MRLFLLLVALCFTVCSASAQFTRQYTDSLVQQLSGVLSDRYIDPELGKKMAEALKANRQAGKYYPAQSGKDLAQLLTSDIRAVVDDRHLSVYFSETKLRNLDGFKTKLTDAQREEIRANLQKSKFGIESVEILDGNIGYIDFRYFGPLEYTEPLLAKAMDTIAGTRALIIDLRRCTGSMSQEFNLMLPGFFFERSQLLSEIYIRSTGQRRENWSYEKVPGRKYLNKPLVILTSGSTFSGGEGFAYEMKHLKRAILVGDITGGAANPVGSITIDDHFGVNMPEGRVKNAVTGSNWEGIGVIPDINVPAIKALHTAHVAVLDSLQLSRPDQALQSTLKKLRENPPVYHKHTFSLQGYGEAKSVTVVGTFNYWGKRITPMVKTANGWEAGAELPEGKTLYRFIVDGTNLKDPANTNYEGNSSLLIIPK